MGRTEMVRWNQVIWCAIGSVSMGLLLPPVAEALMFTVRPGTVFASKPSYKAADRLSIEAIETIVEGPALEQKDTFCLYNLFDRQGKPLSPERAWIPCHSIDKMVPAP